MLSVAPYAFAVLDYIALHVFALDDELIVLEEIHPQEIFSYSRPCAPAYLNPFFVDCPQEKVNLSFDKRDFVAIRVIGLSRLLFSSRRFEAELYAILIGDHTLVRPSIYEEFDRHAGPG